MFFKRRSALVADDDEATLEMLTVLLEAEGWIVRHARSGKEVVRFAKKEPPSVIVLDHRMPDQRGVDAYNELRQDGVEVPAVLLSGAEDIDVLAAASGIRWAFKKPVDLMELVSAMEDAARGGS